MADYSSVHRPASPQNRPSRTDSASSLLGASEKVSNPFQHREAPDRQFRRLLLKGLFGWSLSAIYVAMMFVVFYVYSEKGYNIQELSGSKSDKPVLNLQTKGLFSSIFTGLTLLLGFNVVASFKEMAANFRWRVLLRVNASVSAQSLTGGCAREMRFLHDVLFLSGYHSVLSNHAIQDE